MLLENDDDPFVFIAGNITKQALQEAISFLQIYESPTIYCQPVYHSLFLERGFDLLLRVELTMKPELLTSIAARSHNKDIRPIDNTDLLKKCLWYEKIVAIYGSDKNFLQYGTGYAYVEEGVVLSEAYASIGRGYAEIAIATHPDHRGKGLAAHPLLPLFKKCAVENLIPIWSCQLDNRSSLKAALKLGFEMDRYYVAIVPECGNVLGSNLVKWLKDNPDLSNHPSL
jgi:GNAT superfamily N-acetyltransferase